MFVVGALQRWNSYTFGIERRCIGGATHRDHTCVAYVHIIVYTVGALPEYRSGSVFSYGPRLVTASANLRSVPVMASYIDACADGGADYERMSYAHLIVNLSKRLSTSGREKH